MQATGAGAVFLQTELAAAVCIAEHQLSNECHHLVQWRGLSLHEV